VFMMNFKTVEDESCIFINIARGELQKRYPSPEFPGTAPGKKVEELYDATSASCLDEARVEEGPSFSSSTALQDIPRETSSARAFWPLLFADWLFE